MTKQTLSRYTSLQREIEQLQTALFDHLAKCDLSASLRETMPQAAPLLDNSAILAVETIRLYEKLAAKKTEAVRLCHQIEDAIDGLNPLERVLLRERYILGRDWEQVCDTIGYSWRQTHYLHTAALRKLG
jgi:DNA-directed RNA polymerase specialized sigma24 family protein